MSRHKGLPYIVSNLLDIKIQGEHDSHRYTKPIVIGRNANEEVILCIYLAMHVFNKIHLVVYQITNNKSIDMQ